MNGIMIDTRMKNKVEAMYKHSDKAYSIKFKDLDDTFWFGNVVDLQDFLNQVERERYYDKEVKKGYFTYTNEHGERFKYNVKSNRGTLTLLNEEIISNDSI
jgi:hypothetical protein